ncbi:unnamed protein product [Rotaria socialis]|uniref:Uncharacterized protein n=1 Tax=Rotaria socialis TaxID=392032 RepID=A0A817VXU1_9BILA|nr:unnamed protein product [Rotaria socialis]
MEYFVITKLAKLNHRELYERLNEIFEQSDKSDVYFGNIPVLLFGGSAPFEPVAAKQMFCRPLDDAL